MDQPFWRRTLGAGGIHIAFGTENSPCSVARNTQIMPCFCLYGMRFTSHPDKSQNFLGDG